MKKNKQDSEAFSETPFTLFIESIQQALKRIGFTEPTEPQRIAIDPILRNNNVLLIAPSGSGKTEACLLPVLNNLCQQRSDGQGISVLYITPLRALNRDMLKRMLHWGKYLDIDIEVRHGDTTTKIRRRQALKPPDMMITTPETLQAILPGKRMRENLKNIQWIIIDEIHQLIENRRGIQLSIALERLEEITSKSYQRIGISATVKSPQEVGAFLAGSNRQITVLEAKKAKKFSYLVERPIPTDEDYHQAQQLYTSPEVASRIMRIKDLIDQHSSTLIFVNSRQHAEMLGLRFNMLDHAIAVHHGSLSKDERHKVEDDFKQQRLKGIICTSTLELGIDIGTINLVIQYMSPRQVTPLVQRIGRSGHKSDQTSKGIIISTSTDDSLEALATVELAGKGELEEPLIATNVLDVLGHQIAGLALDMGQVNTTRVFNIIRRAFPYNNLKWSEFESVCRFLEKLRIIDIEGATIKRRGKTRHYYYDNLSTIRDEKRYSILDITTDRKIGILGEEFILTKARIGMNFICRGFVWKIVKILEDSVFVVPSEDPFAAIPAWDGEILAIPYQLAQSVGRLRREIVSYIKKFTDKERIDALVMKYPIERYAIRKVSEEICHLVDLKTPIPCDNIILLEGYRNFIIIHGCFGEAVNRTFGYLFDQLLSENQKYVRWWTDGYRILLEFTNDITSHDLHQIKDIVKGFTSDNIEETIDKYIRESFPFAYDMKFVAQRFGVLPRGIFMTGEKLSEMPRRFYGTPIYLETLREAKQLKIDIPHVQLILKKIHDDELEVKTILSVEEPTPFAYRVLNRFAEAPEMMAPETIQQDSIKRLERAISLSTVELFCLTCGDWYQEFRIKDIPERPNCVRCRSRLLASFRRSSEHAKLCVTKRIQNKVLTPDEQAVLSNVRRNADVVLSYGKKGVIALQVHGIGPQTASRILAKMHYSDEALYRDLLEAKIKYIQTRQYWDR